MVSLRGIAGGVASVLFGFIAWMGQVTPEQAKSNYAAWFETVTSLTPPDWLASGKADIPIMSVFALAAVSLFVWFVWPRTKTVKGQEFLPLREAVTIAYERLRKEGSIYALASEKMGYAAKGESRPEAIISWFCYLLAPRLPIYGKHLPSRIREQIPASVVNRSGFLNGGNVLSSDDRKEPRYAELEVRRADLERVIEDLLNQRQPDEFIPVKDAVILVNDRLHGTANEKYLLNWTDSYPSEAEKIEFGARMLSHNVDLYGTKPLKTVRERIDTSSIDMTMADWRGEGTQIRKMNTKEVMYDNLAFKRLELEAYIESILRGE